MVVDDTGFRILDVNMIGQVDDTAIRDNIEEHKGCLCLDKLDMPGRWRGGALEAAFRAGP